MAKRQAAKAGKTPQKQPSTNWRERKPRLIVKSGEAARDAQREAEQRPVTFWTVMIRLLPVWALVIMVLILEPSLPLQAASTVARWVGGAATPGDQTPAVEPVFIVEGAQEVPIEGEEPPPVNWDLVVSTVFRPEVLYWQDQILAWSQAYRIKPNLIATVMQIESCGNPTAESEDGAKGLFQVADDRLLPGADPFDPETNARYGLTYFAEMYAASNGDIGETFAAYNAGSWIIDASPSEWPEETQRYQFWATGIFEEAERGFTESPTLLDWMAVGGSDLCEAAAVWQTP